MEVKDTLTAALKAVTDANIPEELREVAFAKAVDLLAGTVSPASSRSQATNGAPAPQTGRQEVEPPKVDSGSALDRIASKLDVGRDRVDEVFAESDGTIDIIVSARKLASSKQEGTRQIALLLAAGRQAAGVEEWTGADVIRAKCEDFRKLDSPNFGKALGGMQDEFSLQGPAKKRKVKVSRQGWLAAGDLVKSLTGGTET